MTNVAIRGSRWVVEGTRDLTPEGRELEKLVEDTVKLEPLNWWAFLDNECKGMACECSFAIARTHVLL